MNIRYVLDIAANTVHCTTLNDFHLKKIRFKKYEKMSPMKNMKLIFTSLKFSLLMYAILNITNKTEDF